MTLLPEQVPKALLNEMFYSRWVVVILFVVINVAALAAGIHWPKGYTASTNILVDERTIIQPLMAGAAVATDAMDRSKNAREVIFGRKIMDVVVEYGGWLKTDNPTVPERELIIDGIKKRTTISTLGKNILRIEYQDVDPERAFRVTEKFGELFIQESIAAKAAESAAAFDFINKQTQEYEEKLTRADQELKELRSANLDSAGTDVEVTTKLNDLYKRIDASMQELREAEIKASSLERQISGEAESSAAISREGQYRARIGELQSKLDTLRLSYLDTHPDIVQVKLQIQELTDRVEAERVQREQMKRTGRTEPDESAVKNPIYQQLRREQSQTQGQVEALNARIEDLQRQLQTEVSRGKRMHNSDARLAELTRGYQINKDIYQDFLRRRENARVSMNMDQDRQGLTFKIQEPASLPQSPTGPRFAHFVAAGVLLGMLVPLALIYARLLLDPRVRVGNSIALAHHVPIISVVPHLWSPSELKGLRSEIIVLALIVLSTIGVVGTLSAMRLMKVF
jgi:polysaccharide chain length determinant protein (PEP-CTERM system associated)